MLSVLTSLVSRCQTAFLRLIVAAQIKTEEAVWQREIKCSTVAAPCMRDLNTYLGGWLHNTYVISNSPFDVILYVIILLYAARCHYAGSCAVIQLHLSVQFRKDSQACMSV